MDLRGLFTLAVFFEAIDFFPTTSKNRFSTSRLFLSAKLEVKKRRERPPRLVELPSFDEHFVAFLSSNFGAIEGFAALMLKYLFPNAGTIRPPKLINAEY